TQLGHNPPLTAVAHLKHQYGFDLPWYQQYSNFLGHLIHFDLGYSYVRVDNTVWDILQRSVPASLELGVSGVILAVIVGVPLGVVSAVRVGSRIDDALQSISLALYALPSFVLIIFYQ